MRRRPGHAEVRRFVPAVARRGQRVDDLLEVPLHRVGLTRELLAVRDGETRAGLRLELVAREMLGLEREGRRKVGIEVGGALSGDAVDEIERDVVESGVAESAHGTPDIVRGRLALEHLEEPRLEALRAERDPRHAARSKVTRDIDRNRLRVRLDGDLLRGRQRGEKPFELARLGERRRAAAEKYGLDVVREPVAFEAQLGEESVDVRGMVAASPDDGDEVAVPAAMRAEREVDVEVSDVTPLALALRVEVEDGEERLLRNLHRADLLHALLALLLLLEQLALA